MRGTSASRIIFGPFSPRPPFTSLERMDPAWNVFVAVEEPNLGFGCRNA